MRRTRPRKSRCQCESWGAPFGLNVIINDDGVRSVSSLRSAGTMGVIDAIERLILSKNDIEGSPAKESRLLNRPETDDVQLMADLPVRESKRIPVVAAAIDVGRPEPASQQARSGWAM